ncbi:hypothetical protein, partial [Achromobacter xylosoxidans]|uniref:hypothetical protein n=1 Tax=Alcaligenes xylosoxydans xylosoxydans TaxID=85698 RepID=UPI003D26BE84
ASRQDGQGQDGQGESGCDRQGSMCAHDGAVSVFVLAPGKGRLKGGRRRQAKFGFCDTPCLAARINPALAEATRAPRERVLGLPDIHPFRQEPLAY